MSATGTNASNFKETATAADGGATARNSSARLWLRRLLVLDAVVTGVNGLAYLAASGPLGRLLGVGQDSLLWIGAFLVLYAAAVGGLASRPVPAASAVRLVIDLNLVWVVLSVLAMVFWLDGLSTAGYVWTCLQAAVVGAFAVLQYASLRRIRP
ncbi:hypothetical protein [Streptomyces iconiensis]|uniref:Integral membrane protein n=1 Tax=Streptomyces iconiensis TaxID=1384038 RepID=A0ABT6ZQP5_9ACTN|nr:hypothetical protein [Streptomyces iconiensis]MDJ1131006.1 hypothetical protein [Streptomyces iconiensis]